MPSPESSESKMANCSSDLYMPDEFVELLWDNGPMLQGQSHKTRRSSTFTALPSSGGRILEKDSKDNPYPKIGHFRASEPKSNNLPSPGYSPGFAVNAHDNDIVPWINYPMEDPIHHDYCSEFLNDYSGINLNSLHSRTNTVPVRGSYRDSDNVEQGHPLENSRTGSTRLFQVPPQSSSSVPPSAKSSEMDLGIGSNSKAHKESGGTGIVNFSHFFRPVLGRANLHSQRPESNNKGAFAVSSNPIESTIIEPASGSKNVLRTQDEPSLVQPRENLTSSCRPSQDTIMGDQTNVICEGDTSKKGVNHNTTTVNCRSPDRVQSSSFAASVALGTHESEKGNEAAVAASSVCSGSSTGPTSNDHKCEEKRKHHEGAESGYQSEDLEDESVELKKSSAVQGKNKKRSRAAEVHNLSERRRRDRINERMRALQELIPNCNKTDKASMLDEAIEYLKSLQMQVQIMSMGGGLCMSPMMMQHMRGPSMAHFSPMGIGMGMGMGLGYGMGVYDMHGSPGCSFIPVHPFQRPQFPCPSIPGTTALHRMAGPSSLPMFGIPGQGVPVSMPYRQPPTTVADTKTSSVAATKSENHRHNKTEDSDIK